VRPRGRMRPSEAQTYAVLHAIRIKSENPATTTTVDRMSWHSVKQGLLNPTTVRSCPRSTRCRTHVFGQIFTVRLSSYRTLPSSDSP
jgi:hypothetical protein